MPSSDPINVDELLQPISEDNPVGSDIRENISHESAFYEIKDARNSARQVERNSSFVGADASSAHESWSKVMTLAPKILIND